MIQPREDQRLKAAGIALLIAGGAGFAWLSANAAAQWPIAAERFSRFVLCVMLGINVLFAGLILLATGCGATQPWRDGRHRRALALRVLLANALVPAAVYGLLSSDESIKGRLADSDWEVPVSAAGTVLLVIAWRLWRRSQRHEAPSAEEAMAADPRPPVLYLRSFKDDGSAILDDGGSKLMRRMFAALAPQTPEQELADLLRHVGPVVAIGKPGEPLPELGAARLYVTNDQWQHAVTDLMKQAALVVVRIGSSAGVLWEIEHALSLIPRERLVLALMSGSEVAPELAAGLASTLKFDLHAALPEAPPKGWIRLVRPHLRRRIGSIVCFAPDGTACPVPVSMWPPWGRDLLTIVSFRPSAMPLRRAWRQIFGHLGIPAGKMSDRRSRAVAVALALAFGYAGAHWFYLGDRRRGWKYVALFPAACASLFMAYYDALRFVWVDRATFDARFGAKPGSVADTP